MHKINLKKCIIDLTSHSFKLKFFLFKYGLDRKIRILISNLLLVCVCSHADETCRHVNLYGMNTDFCFCCFRREREKGHNDDDGNNDNVDNVLLGCLLWKNSRYLLYNFSGFLQFSVVAIILNANRMLDVYITRVVVMYIKHHIFRWHFWYSPNRWICETFMRRICACIWLFSSISFSSHLLFHVHWLVSC